jgi:hypothetical protein
MLGADVDNPPAVGAGVGEQAVDAVYAERLLPCCDLRPSRRVQEVPLHVDNYNCHVAHARNTTMKRINLGVVEPWRNG